MRRALLVSLAFHAGLTGLVVGLSQLEAELPATETPVTVEIVVDPAVQAPAPAPLPPRPPAAETAPVPQRQAAAPPPPPPAPRVEPKLEAKPPPPAPPPPPPAQVAEAEPEPPPEPRPAPAPAPERAPERTEVKPPTPAPPKPQPRKPEPPPKPAAEAPAKAKPEPRKEVAAAPKPEKPRTPPAAKAEASDFDALLRSVEAQTKRVSAPEKRAGKGASAEAGGTGQPGEAKVAQVNPSILVAAVSRQVTPCWNIPIAAQGVASLRAELAIELGPDGAVQTVAPTDAARMASDPVFRAFAESAVRAVRSCSPLKLPPESYQVWRNIIFNFEPSLLAG